MNKRLLLALSASSLLLVTSAGNAVTSSVLTNKRLTPHPKRVIKQGVSVMLTPFLLPVAAKWRQRFISWQQTKKNLLSQVPFTSTAGLADSG